MKESLYISCVTFSYFMTIARLSYKSNIISVHLVMKSSCSTSDTLCIGNGKDESVICIGNGKDESVICVGNGKDECDLYR